jgi:glycosyltransferase involved in cell wall biosynthesis
VRRLQTRNFAQVTTMLSADAGISPTRWQKAGYPDALRQKIGIIHEGIDTEFCRPDADARFTLPDGQVLRAGDRVVTYAARHLEPYRGFVQFMRAAAELARRDRLATFVVAGADGTAYGTDPGNGRTWREVMVEETGIDPSRIHFVGTLSHDRLIQLFQVSAVHVYLTYPFVLSWSMLEAMAAGVYLVGSDTAPVTEFVEHGRNGHLVPFFDVEALAAALGEALEARPSSRLIRRNARDTVMRQVGLAACLRRQADLIGELLGAPKIWK